MAENDPPPNRWFNDTRFNFVRSPQQLRQNINRLLSDVDQFYRQNPELIAPIRQQVQIISDLASGVLNPNNNPPPIVNPIQAQNSAAIQGLPTNSNSVAVNIEDMVRQQIVTQVIDNNGQNDVAEANDNENANENVENNSTNENAAPNLNVNAQQTINDDFQQLVTLIQGNEIQAVLKYILGFLPFIVILLAKFLLNHFFLIVNFLFCFSTFLVFDLFVKNFIVEKSTQSRVHYSHIAGVMILCIIALGLFVLSISSNFTAICMMTSFPLPSFCPAPDLCLVFYVTAMCDFIIKFVFMSLKVLVAMSPTAKRGIFGPKWKRQVYQLLELTCRTFRIIWSCRTWTVYILRSHSDGNYASGVAYSLLTVYWACKLYRLLPALKEWREAAKNTCKPFAYGNKPTQTQLNQAGDSCSICFSNFVHPVALECQHIFCDDCVSTWLDKESTCPICRAVAKTPDTKYKNGATQWTVALF